MDDRAWRASKCILVVEDDAAVREAVCDLLRDEGYEVAEASDGRRALAQLEEAARRPDLILLDLMMPVMDGWQFRVAQRQHPDLAHVPVVALSAGTDAKAEAIDADAFVRKPFTADQLRSTAERVLLVRERERSEAALRRSEEANRRLAALVRASNDAILSYTARGTLEDWNPAAERLFGGTGAPAARELAQILPTEDATRREELLARLGRGEGVTDVETTHRAGNREVTVSLTLSPILDQAQRLSHVAVIARDVSDRKAVEEALRESQRLLEEAQAVAHVGSWVSSAADGGAILWSSETYRMLGVPEGTPLHIATFLALVHADDRTRVQAARAAALRAGTTYDVEYRVVRPDGQVRWIHSRGSVIRDTAGEPLRLAGVAQDVTDRRQTERALQAAEHRLRALVTEVPIVISALDARGVFALSEGKGLEALGLLPGQVVGQSALELYRGVPWMVGAVERALRGEAVSASGELAGRWLEAHFRPERGAAGELMGVLGVAIDLTERRKLETQLMLSERMVSIGTLAAGVAHEINNPLAYVVANLEFALREISGRGAAADPMLAEVSEALHEARQGAERVRLIVRDLKAFSRPNEESVGAVDLHRVLESSINLSWNEIRHRARLVKEFKEVPLVDANEARLGQVFLNLLVNAAQAIGEGAADRNEIRVSTGTTAEGRAVVEVRDSGGGMPPEVARRCFEPFFTTKAIGVGTGLGLAICHGIVQGLSGQIEVQTEPGRGTTFRVTLPAGHTRAPLTRARLAPGATSRRGRILVIDDEPIIGAAIRRALGREHEVHVLTRASDALERLGAGERFDVILCDIMMPEMTGMDLHEAVSNRDPECAARMIFLTGGAFTARAREFLDTVSNLRIEKPFDTQNLRAIVNDRLR